MTPEKMTPAEATEILRKKQIVAPSLEDEPYTIDVIMAFITLELKKTESPVRPMPIRIFFSEKQTPANHSRHLFHEDVLVGQNFEKIEADKYLRHHWSTKDEVV
jgi:hypothetical protein